MAISFDTHKFFDEKGIFTYGIKNSTVDEAITKAAEVIKETIRKENPNACTYEACVFIAQKTAEFFQSNQLI